MTITITTAIDLDADYIADIAAKIADAKELDMETIDVDHIVDPTVVGGLKVRIGARTVDATLKRRLQDIKSHATQS